MAVFAFTKDQSRDSIKVSGEAHLRQHPVNSVGLFADILDKEDLSFCFYLVWSAERSRNQGEITAHKRPRGRAGSNRTKRVFRAQGVVVDRICYLADRVGLKQ